MFIVQAKLSGKNKATAIIWVAEEVLASCSDESVIRYVLSKPHPRRVRRSTILHYQLSIIPGGYSEYLNRGSPKVHVMGRGLVIIMPTVQPL